MKQISSKAVLLILSFPFTGGLAFLGFIAWVPLLLVENSILHAKLRSGKVFVHAYLAFFIYNIGTNRAKFSLKYPFINPCIIIG